MRFQTRRDIQYITYFTLLLVTLLSCIKARNGKLNVDNYSLYFLLWLVKDFDIYIYIYISMLHFRKDKYTFGENEL